jgi:uncharacterized protein YpmS
MKKPQIRYFLALLALGAATLACSIPVSGPTPPPSPEPLSTEQVLQFEQQIQETLVNPAPSGEVTITITEQQLNSFLVSKLAEQPDQLITDPQIVLTNGQVEIYGKTNQGGLNLNSRIIVAPGVDANGDPRLEVVSINLGPIQVTDALKEKAQNLVDTMLSDYVSTNSGKFKITSIKVADKQLTVTGIPQTP